MKKRVVMILCAMGLCISMAGCGLLPFSGDMIGATDSQESSADVSSEQDSDISFSSTPEEEEETEKQETSETPLEKADLMAQQYDYDGAIELLKEQPDYESDSEMQDAVKAYEEQKAECVA